MDLDRLLRARTGLAIEDFFGITWFHATPLRSPAQSRRIHGRRLP
jgi:hypothetical protein